MTISFDSFDALRSFVIVSGLFVEQYRYEVMAEERDSERKKRLAAQDVQDAQEERLLTQAATIDSLREDCEHYQRRLNILDQTISDLQDRVSEGVSTRLYAENHCDLLFRKLIDAQKKDYLAEQFETNIERIKFLRMIHRYGLVEARAFLEYLQNLNVTIPLLHCAAPSNEAEGLVEYLENIPTNES